MKHALILKQFIDVVKDTVSDRAKYQIPKDFAEWIKEQSQHYALDEQLKTMEEINSVLGKIREKEQEVKVLEAEEQAAQIKA
jgi:hypothetical protein